MASTGDILWIEAADQRLGLVPALGGSVAEWAWLGAGEPAQLWRPWDRSSEDRYTLASFAMLPWSNRISHGGFEHRGEWHPMAPNRSGEPYPIHGDGWLQAWTSTRTAPNAVELHLHSRRHGGNPYEYDAVQRFELVPGGLDQSLTVTHRGARPLPYGLGLHPWFPRTPRTTLQARVSGVWLSGDDPIPTRHTSELPDTWDLNAGADMNGGLIDNAYTGWDGRATIRWPERGLALHLYQDPLSTPLRHGRAGILPRLPLAGRDRLLLRADHPADRCLPPRRPPRAGGTARGTADDAAGALADRCASHRGPLMSTASLHSERVEAFETEMSEARLRLAAGDPAAAFASLERAHVLGQIDFGRHLRVHLRMLRAAWTAGNSREVRGQLLRIALVPSAT